MNDKAKKAKKAVADVDFTNGVAIVYEPDGRIYLLEYDKSEPVDGTRIHPRRYLQPAINEVDTCSAGEYPYAELHAEIRRMYGIRRAIQLVLDAVNPVFSSNLRCRLARLALLMLQATSVKDGVEEAFAKQALLETAAADLQGLPDEFCDFIRPFLPSPRR